MALDPYQPHQQWQLPADPVDSTRQGALPVHAANYRQNPDDIGAYVCTVGDINVHTRYMQPHSTRHIYPTPGSTWSVLNAPATVQKTTTAGIVLAVISVVLAVIGAVFTCGISLILLLGLLFLLSKESKVEGHVQIAVQTRAGSYLTSEWISTAAHMQALYNRINACQQVARMPGL